MKLDLETADAICELMHSPKFKQFMTWFDQVHAEMVSQAIHGVSKDYSADVLRGRAQALGLLKGELTKAPEVASRIVKPNGKKPSLQRAMRNAHGTA